WRVGQRMERFSGIECDPIQGSNVSSVPAFPITIYPQRIFEPTLILIPVRLVRTAGSTSELPSPISGIVGRIDRQFQSLKIGAILLPKCRASWQNCRQATFGSIFVKDEKQLNRKDTNHEHSKTRRRSRIQDHQSESGPHGRPSGWRALCFVERTRLSRRWRTRWRIRPVRSCQTAIAMDAAHGYATPGVTARRSL